MNVMKKIVFPIMLLTILIMIVTCKKEKESENVSLLTAHPWMSDSLLADGMDVGAPGGILHGFSGETKFNTDGTGYVGIYDGEWNLSEDETILSISSDSLPAKVFAVISELTETSLKLSTLYPSPTTPGTLLDIRMTFIPK